MAPSNNSSQQTYSRDEKVLCFHHELLYEAKILDSKLSDPNDKRSQMLYRVHYKGWKNTWDDWVSGERIRKLTEENKELAQNLKKDLDAQRRPAKAAGVGKKKNAGSDSSNRGSEERHSSVPVTGRGQKRGRDYDLDKEEAFHSRPEIRIPTTDKMKSILVDDWENVTKNLWLVPLPSKTPVSLILSTYFEEEKGKRRLGSPEADLLEEITSGLIEYFGVSLGRVLLYTFERDQYAEIRSRWEETAGDETWEQQGCADTYGAEHLVRLFVTVPELIAQTNMDAQSIQRLREEITKLMMWITKHSGTYFNEPYVPATQEYIDKARGH